MGKKGDPKVPILPSTTRKGTVLSTSATLDSPSVISKFASPPPPPPHATSAESGNMSDTFDDASTTLDDIGSLGYALEKQIAAAAKQSGIEIPVTRYPIGATYDYPDLSDLKKILLENDMLFLMMIYEGNLQSVPTLTLVLLRSCLKNTP